jgi:hypothetical protein
VRKRKGILKATSGSLLLALLCLASAAPLIAARGEKVLRTPRKSWDRQEDKEAGRIILVNNQRLTAIDIYIGNTLPNKADVNRLAKTLLGQSDYTLRGPWSQEMRDQAEVNFGYSVSLPDGRKGFYAAVWKQRSDGRYNVTGYMAIVTEYTAANNADFEMVRSYGNQLSRGAVLFATLPAVVEPEKKPSVIAAGPILPVDASVSKAAVSTAEAPISSAIGTDTVNISAAAVSAPSPAPAAVVAAPAAMAAYPFMVSAGSGVLVKQISSLLYTPLESSEVFVLFKDGSFHENIPVALEQWNVAAAREGDPSSWGSWKAAKDEGDFELKYAEDDIVTIRGVKIKPAKAGLQLQGTYGVEQDDGLITDEIRFAGNRFEMDLGDATKGGTYKVDGYSIILTHDDGRVEHLPFFIAPIEEAGDEPSLWLGDSLRDRID